MLPLCLRAIGLDKLLHHKSTGRLSSKRPLPQDKFMILRQEIIIDVLGFAVAATKLFENLALEGRVQLVNKRPVFINAHLGLQQQTQQNDKEPQSVAMMRDCELMW